MKNIKIYTLYSAVKCRSGLFSLFAAACLLVSCGDNETEVFDNSLIPAITVSSNSPYVSIDPAARICTAALRSGGDPISINIESNYGGWKISAVEESWLSIDETAAGIVLSAETNVSDRIPTATFYVTTTDGSNSSYYTFEVSQRGLGTPEINVSSSVVMLPGNGLYTRSVTVETNQDEWRFDLMSQWLLAEASGDQLNFTAYANTTGEDRTTIVTISSGYGRYVDEAFVTVTQTTNSDIIITPTYYMLASEGGKVFIEVLNTETDLGISDNDYDWIEVTVEDDGNVTFAVAENENPEMRRAEIGIYGFTGEDTTEEVTVSVIQAGTHDMVLDLNVVAFMTAALPLYGDVDVTIYWGDGSEQSTKNSIPLHDYTASGTYTVIVSGTSSMLYNAAYTHAYMYDYVTRVRQWGKLGAVSMREAFNGCKNLASIPGDKVGSFEDVTVFYAAFCGTAIEEIPEDLFAYCEKAYDMRSIFESCANITEIPEGLFDNCPQAYNFRYTFYKTSLKSIPPALFDECNTNRIDTIMYVFGDTDITTIPEGLFSKIKGMNSVSYAFSGCKNLTSVPAGLFKENTKIKNFSNLFAGCTALTSIDENIFSNSPDVVSFYATFRETGLTNVPANIFANNPLVENFGYVFYGCTSLTSIPGNIFAGNPAATSFTRAFYGCNNAAFTTLPGDLFANNVNAESFDYAFYNCNKLTSLPSSLFASNSKATTFESCFYGCSGLTSLPSGLFSGCTSALTYANLFQGCTSLASINGPIFQNNTSAATFSNLFYGCSSLASIPAGMFDQCTSATTFAAAFRGCSSLGSLPSGLFDNCTNVTSFANTFYQCGQLASLPSGLFDNCTKVTNFGNCFYQCSKLTSLPDGLFVNCRSVTTFTYLFYQCTGLTQLPNSLFPTLSNNVTMTYVFDGCSGLQSIPGNLFAGLPAVTSFNYVFRNCSSLQSLPTELFDNNLSITSMTSAFQNCSALSGESPYIQNGSEKIHLYDRNSTVNGYTTIGTRTNCFSGCTNLSDYSSIPSAWGGGA